MNAITLILTFWLMTIITAAMLIGYCVIRCWWQDRNTTKRIRQFIQHEVDLQTDQGLLISDLETELALPDATPRGW